MPINRYNVHKSPTPVARLLRRLRLVFFVILGLVIVGGLVTYHQYSQGMRPVSANQTTQLFTIDTGSSVTVIAGDLEKAHLIRSAWVMELYVATHRLGSKLQAGTFALSPSDGTAPIVWTLSGGKTSTKLITILPGKRVDQVQADLINDGFSPAEVAAAFTTDQYSDVPVLALKPAGVTSLEGLLWPDSFQKDTTTTVSDIVRQSIQETGQHMTADVQAAFAAEGLTPYQGLILTSIITQEVSNPADQPQVAQVFLSRLKTGMLLGSDVTANYGAIAAGRQPSLTYDSPYNTLLHRGLPPTPISNVTTNALTAATHPASTTWLYFVAGDDGTTYFSNTLQEHQALTQKYCHKLCGN